MEFALLVYFASVVPNLAKFFGMACFLLVILAYGIVIFTYTNFYSSTSQQAKAHGRARWLIALSVTFAAFSGLAASLIPTKEAAYAIAAAYAAEKIYQSEDFKRIAGKSLAVIEVKLDEIIEKKEAK